MGYDVFFSFRIKCFFKSSLESSLRANNIKTFIDDKYDKGKIPPSVLRAIEASRISVVVFTEEFGDSRRNLQKLEMMMKMHRKKGQVVLPMYYGVKVWEVRKQSGKFGEAFEGLMKGMCVMEDQVLRWRRELAQVTCLPGWNVSFSSISHSQLWILALAWSLEI